MTYSDQWTALSSRIRGLTQAGELHAHFLIVKRSDTYNASSLLREQCERVLAALRSFRDDFESLLAPAALDRIDEFLATHGDLMADTSATRELQRERLFAALVVLGAFESEMSFVLSDVQETIRTRSELAFSHLQRSIVADPTFREKWKTAFEEGEVACEKLGAVHLLLHGIWAFKVNAEGERTDLVFQEPRDLTNEQRFVEGFVLTEWKKIGTGDNPESKFSDARSQADRYAQGALSGTELTAYRYAVVVSEQHVNVPDDQRVGGIVYRHINVAVEPLPPSRR